MGRGGRNCHVRSGCFRLELLDEGCQNKGKISWLDFTWAAAHRLQVSSKPIRKKNNFCKRHSVMTWPPSLNRSSMFSFTHPLIPCEATHFYMNLGKHGAGKACQERVRRLTYSVDLPPTPMNQPGFNGMS